MAKSFKCDVCGKFVDDFKKKTEFRVRRNMDEILINRWEYEDKFDLCEDCSKKIGTFFNKLRRENKENNNG